MAESGRIGGGGDRDDGGGGGTEWSSLGATKGGASAACETGGVTGAKLGSKADVAQVADEFDEEGGCTAGMSLSAALGFGSSSSVVSPSIVAGCSTFGSGRGGGVCRAPWARVSLDMNQTCSTGRKISRVRFALSKVARASSVSTGKGSAI